MTISSTVSRVSYSGNGVTTAFSFPYYFLASADLIVISKDNSTGVETTLALTTDYTIAGAGVLAGGTVTLLVAPATGKTIIIYRDPTQTQDLDLVENDSLPAEELEKRLDKLTMLAQRLKDRVDRSVRLTDGYAASFTPTLPSSFTANAVLAINGTGDGILMGPTVTDVASAATNATAAATSATSAASSATSAAASATAAATSASVIPTQTGNNGKFLQTNGTVPSWATVDQPTIYSGVTDVKSVRDIFSINDKIKLLVGTADPTSSAQDAPAGSTYTNTTTATIYRKIDAGSTTNWIPVGADGGLNFVGLNSSFLLTTTNDRNAETSVGSWAAYADAAGTTPVDMTGGSPATTIARTTTAGEILNGTASFKVVKAASNKQGEGVSLLVNIPTGYKSSKMSISGILKIISGSLSAGDLKMAVYDVTNSALLSVLPATDVLATGAFAAMVQLSNTSSLRVGLHFASTSTTAVTFSFDEFTCTLAPPLHYGMNATDWVQDNTFTTAGFGTITTANFWRRRVGDTLHVKGGFVTGTVSATLAQIILPSGFVIDSTKYSSTGVGQRVGFFYTLPGGGINTPSTTTGPFPISYDGTTTSGVFICNNSNSAFAKTAGSGVSGSATNVDIEFSVAISGWSANGWIVAT